MARVAVASTTIWPASEGGKYGSEPANGMLAHALERRGHTVTLLAPPGSHRWVMDLRYIPGGRGQALLSNEAAVYEWHQELFRGCDWIIDMTGNHILTERLQWYEPELKAGVATYHNGNLPIWPRRPVWARSEMVAYSEAQKDEWIRTATVGVHPERIHVCPYGVQTDLYVPCERNCAEINLGGKEKPLLPGYFLFLARPTRTKGIFDFVELAKDHPEKSFVAAFDMAAKDHEKDGKEALGLAEGLSNFRYVPLDGLLTRKISLYQHAKAVVAPLDAKYVEGLGRTNLESQSCGTPVITAAHGGQIEVMSERTSILCSAGDLDAYGAAIERADGLSREECRRLMISNFTLDAWAQRVELIMEQITKKRGTRP